MLSVASGPPPPLELIFAVSKLTTKGAQSRITGENISVLARFSSVSCTARPTGLGIGHAVAERSQLGVTPFRVLRATLSCFSHSVYR